jgi:hypothetical protein
MVGGYMCRGFYGLKIIKFFYLLFGLK